MAGVNTLVGQSEERGALSLVYCATQPELQGAPCPGLWHAGLPALRLRARV